jgi:PAS domain S-box-containing protein
VVILSSINQLNLDEDKTKEQLIEELAQLRKQLDDLKSSNHAHRVHNAMSRFEAVIENTPMVAVQGYDEDGVICHWNEACKYLYGYSAEEAIGKRMQDLIVCEDDIEIFESTLKKICDTGQPAPYGVWKLKAKDGGIVWAYSSMFPIIEDGGVAEIFCMDVDITEQRNMEESLRKNEEHLRTLINAMPDIICFKDGEGRWLEANEFDLRLFDIENVRYQGKKDSELAEFSDFYRDAFLTCEETDEAA